jgi:FKBP-type peptidyl-prolyl cis-trans isomerase FkpA
MAIRRSVILLSFTLVGCTTNDTFVTVPNEQPTVTEQRYLAWNIKLDGWAQTASGLEYRRIGDANPSGATPLANSIVTADCEGHFVDGRLFFATDPGKPLVGPLTKLIKGWQEGLLLMHTGETWEFAVPAALAYGAKGWTSKSPNIPSIPPNTALLFKIKLIAVAQPSPQ